MALSRTAALLAIGGYRRYVSPYKGFKCAHNALHGEGSCSDYGLAVFAAHDLRIALQLVRARLADCKAAAAMTSGAGMSTAGKAPGNEEEEARRRRSDSAGPCDIVPSGADCTLPRIQCFSSAEAIDVCSLGEACACSW